MSGLKQKSIGDLFGFDKLKQESPSGGSEVNYLQKLSNVSLIRMLTILVKTGLDKSNAYKELRDYYCNSRTCTQILQKKSRL